MELRKILLLLLVAVLMTASVATAIKVGERNKMEFKKYWRFQDLNGNNGNFSFNSSSLSLDGKIEDSEMEQFKSFIPETYAATEDKIGNNSRRFIMWTYDGEHIMWGKFGRGYFVAKDNLGKDVWGIYGWKFFSGFYDGKFFWGRFNGKSWKAEGLFGLEKSHGKYVVFPMNPGVLEDAK